ncbi:MAG: sulfatase-like hydrolase/transferase [Verrucomicrobia bacterium]|nr:sulfatase-like hydrolase/transferase [Verrucomicrobiota bacterium]
MIHLCRSFFLIATWFTFAVAAMAATASSPNILFIYTDDQSYRTLGCYRDQGAWPWVRTPNIDRLASDGVRFTSAYGASWCTPSRACVMTGLLPHGIRGLTLTGIIKGSYDPQVCRHWPTELRKAGYHTAMIGKWHLSHDAGHGRNWDHSVVWDQADIKGDWYNNQTLSVDGAPKAIVPGYSTDVYTRFAEDYVRRKHDQPWMLWLCYNASHLPNTVHPRHKEQYKDADVPVPPDVFPPRPGKPAHMQTWTQWTKREDGMPVYGKAKNPQPLPELVRGYNRLVSALDEGVGKLLKALEETGQLDNTLIVYTSDQGFAWGEHGFAWKVGAYDACIKAPMIFRLPGRVARGGVCKQPVTVVDLAPTLLGVAGVKLPWTMHGRDLRPLLKNPNAAWNRPAMMEHFYLKFGEQTDCAVPAKGDQGPLPWWISLRHGKYKYIRTLLPDEIEELYDLEADPQEMTNLALAPENRKLLADFRAKFVAELKRTNAGLLKNLPPPRSAN